MEGFGIFSQFDTRVIIVPGILQTVACPLGPL